MLGTRHSFLFLTVLLALLVLSPKVGSAQANEAPVIGPGMIIPPDGDDTTHYGSATGPTDNVLGSTWLDCEGVGCLSAAEKSELNELCKLAGAQWQDYELCRQAALSLLNPQP